MKELNNKIVSNTNSELAILNVAKIIEMQTCFKCDKCEIAVASFVLLRLHDKTSHCMNKVTQSRTFV